MLDVSWSNAYKQDYKRAKKRGLNMKKLYDVIDALRKGKNFLHIAAHIRCPENTMM